MGIEKTGCPYCGSKMILKQELPSRRIRIWVCPECGVRAEEQGVKHQENDAENQS